MDTSSRLTLRIFISSPGDVPVERDRAADVVARLREEFVHYAVLEPFFWEDQPARATDTFQSQFPEASGMGIVVGILWARIGTPLPLDKARPDGRRYESGTVYELETAAEAYQSRGSRSRRLPQDEQPTATAGRRGRAATAAGAARGARGVHQAVVLPRRRLVQGGVPHVQDARPVRAAAREAPAKADSREGREGRTAGRTGGRRGWLPVVSLGLSFPRGRGLHPRGRAVARRA